MPAWQLRPGRSIPLDRPALLAILNVTPDSFADGGLHASVPDALAAARRFVDQDADVIDIGGESTRPGAAAVGEEEQRRRVIPVIRAIRAAGGALASIPLTIDTTRAAVAARALDAGADAVNDVSAGLDDPGMLPLAASRSCGMILMHRLARPSQDRYSDQYDAPPPYADVVEDVARFLDERARAAVAAGVPPGGIIIDPGLGFGKSVEQNLALIDGTPRLAALGYPVLSALSRKSFVGRVSLGRDSTPDERLPGTLALSLRHVRAGASLLRVHDVAAHAAALAAWRAVPRG